MTTEISSVEAMHEFGRKIGAALKGGEVFELLGDIGAGKTTFTKGLGEGLGVSDDVQSPSFTISRIYEARDGLELHHYDFYRLTDAGVLSFELAESLGDPKTVTVVEWAETVGAVLPERAYRVMIKVGDDPGKRQVTVTQAAETEGAE